MQERREFARVEDDAIRFRWPGSRRDEPVANLSRSGAKLFTMRSAPVGSLVELELLREGADPLALVATVRRVERPTRSDREASLGMSVEFREIDPEKNAVLVRWTGDDSPAASAAADPGSPPPAAAASNAQDHRGKLWESPARAQGAGERPQSESDSGRDGTDAGQGATESISVDSASSEGSVAAGAVTLRIQDLEARLQRAEALAAEALVQLARAERRVEQLEARDAAVPEQPDAQRRPYAGGDDGTSILEDPLVAELFSRPVDDPTPGPVEETADSEPQRSDEGSPSTQPAIEMIGRVEEVERRGSRADRSTAAAQTQGPKGPISDAVAGFHRLAEDPLDTVGFSRSELLGGGAVEAASESDESATADEPESPASSSAKERSAGIDGSSEASSGGTRAASWRDRDSLAMKVSEDEVFVEVVGLEDDEAAQQDPSEDLSTQHEPAEDPDGESSSVDAATGAWPDLEVEDPIDEDELAAVETGGARETETQGPETPPPDGEAEVADPAESADPAGLTDSAAPTDLALSPEAEEAVEYSDSSPTSTDPHRIEQASDAAAFEDPAVVVDDDASAFEATSAEHASDAEGEPESGADVSDASAELEPADDEIEAAISASMVEEIVPAAGSKAVESERPLEETPEPGADAVEVDDEDRSQDLTLSDLPTWSEMVEAMRSGRIVRTSRFHRLEPVSRLDIEISDLLRSSDRLDDLEAKTRGRIAPTALHRVLFVFFERGLIAVDPEG